LSLPVAVGGGATPGAGDLPRLIAPLSRDSATLGGGGGCPVLAFASASWARREATEARVVGSPRDSGVTAGAGSGDGGSEAAMVCCQA
jgi:hypothetical protein